MYPPEYFEPEIEEKLKEVQDFIEQASIEVAKEAVESAAEELLKLYGEDVGSKLIVGVARFGSLWAAVLPEVAKAMGVFASSADKFPQPFQSPYGFSPTDEGYYLRPNDYKPGGEESVSSGAAPNYSVPTELPPSSPHHAESPSSLHPSLHSPQLYDPREMYLCKKYY